MESVNNQRSTTDSCYSRAESFKLSNDDAAALSNLVKRGDIGSTKSEVIRHLIRRSSGHHETEKSINSERAKTRPRKKAKPPKNELLEVFSIIQCDLTRMNNLIDRVAKSLEVSCQINDKSELEFLAFLLSLIKKEFDYLRTDHINQIEKITGKV